MELSDGMLLSLTLALASVGSPLDFTALDEAIERCDRDTVLPTFAAEPQRRSAFVTKTYEEQARIIAEKLVIAGKRRDIREAAPRKSDKASLAEESDRALALGQLALEDQQRALDDGRRLEAMRQEAVDLKRQYFLARCSSARKKD